MHRKTEWKWRVGTDEPERSSRQRNNYQNEGGPGPTLETNVMNQCLFSDDDGIFTPSSNSSSSNLFGLNGFEMQSNKREDTYSRMAEREMVQQIGMNPFLAASSNTMSYVDDLMKQDTFLRPMLSCEENKLGTE